MRQALLAADQTRVYLPLKTAQRLLGEGDVVSEVGVKVSDVNQAPALASELNASTSYVVKSWQDKSRDILQALETQKTVSVIFYLLIFAIAGFVVANTMIMTVKRRTKEIGILMAMGANRRSIVGIFLAETLILGPPSALLGILLAYIVAKLIEAYPIDVPSEIYMVSRMTVELTPQIYLYAVVFALAINFLAGIFPAIKASRLDPVEAIEAE